MIAISSIRPHVSDAAYRENQIRAKQSWEVVFDRIVYFAKREPDLDSPKTEWVEPVDYPFIWQMAEFASKQRRISAIINADIVVTPTLRNVMLGMERSYFLGATSRRFDLETKKLNPDDKGRDIFVLKPSGWKKVAALIPRSCRIGHNEWDSWMIGFMRKEFKKRFGEFTQCECIFHPKHEGRRQPFVESVDITSPYKEYWDGTPDVQIASSI